MKKFGNGFCAQADIAHYLGVNVDDEHLRVTYEGQLVYDDFINKNFDRITSECKMNVVMLGRIVDRMT